MRYALTLIIIALIGFVPGCGQKEQAPMPVLSPNAPQDRPTIANGHAQIREYEAAMAPYVQKARQTYPAARQRYLDGLPAGYGFFAVTRLKDRAGRREQVFVAVTSIQGGRIRGRLASETLEVSGYKNGDEYAFDESELVDWLITHPDGTEEGNVVGKFLDEFPKDKSIKN
jgi:hypothetical protein